MMLHRLLTQVLAWRTSAPALLVLAAIGVTGCERVPLLAPTNSSLSVTANAITIPSSGSTVVSAMVLESAGTPVHNGTTVRFTTDLGRVEPATAQTTNGVATTTFFADGTSGIASIRASSGAASGGTGENVTNMVQVTVGAAGVTTINVRANPATVPVAGGSVEIIANAVGANNAPLRGVPVAFSTDQGSLSATSVVTDANGEARTTLTTNRASKVTATVGNVSATVDVALRTPGTVTLAASGTPIAGQSFALEVTPAAGTAPRVVIAWGDGSETDLGLVSAARTVTHIYNESGSYAIVATATDNGETHTNGLGVTVAPRPSPTITVSPTGGSGTVATNFIFTVTPPTTGAGLRNVRVDFGDGTQADLGAVTGATQVSHQYGSTGVYTIRATLTDGTGAETSAAIVVTVQ